MSQMNYEYCDGVTHTIKQGDTLYEISRKYNVALALLLRANPYVDVFNLQVGDTICIPTSQNQMTPYPVSGMMSDGNSMGKMARQGRMMQDDEEISCTGEIRKRKDTMSSANGQMSETVPISVNVNTAAAGNPAGMATEVESQAEEPAGEWEKYVVKPGDTLADILQEMDGDLAKFLEKNDISTIYMLPGVAYYIWDSDS